MNNKDLYTIRQVIDLTGISEFTLRGWENRYNAFSPIRTESDRRLYQRKDIQKALLLRDLLKQGYRIGKLSLMNQEELELLLNKKSAETEPQKPKQIIEILNLISLQKWRELDLKIRKLKYETELELITNLILPMIKGVSELVENKQLSIAQEHIASSYIKEKIYSAICTKKNSIKEDVRFICATPEKDFHELGILSAHLLIKSHGYQSLYVGPNTPHRDLVETALNYRATHILIASTIRMKKGSDQEFLTYLHHVTKNTDQAVKIYIAGSQSLVYSEAVTEKIHPLKSFTELNSELICISKSRKKNELK
ncbi:MAG: MerR family transcriptional regulator [Oligoflexia bacterium]|nr:MerR family transcriptional regulator [Oligoflexia bacterium]